MSVYSDYHPHPMDVAIPTLDQVVAKVDAFLARHGMAESRLGREATGESSLITTMREGRHPSLKTLNRLDDYMTEQDARLTAETGTDATGKSCDPSGTVALCPKCEERPDSPAAKACTDSDCGLALRPAA